MDRVENKIIVDQIEMDANVDARIHMIKMLRKTTLEKLDPYIEAGKWYRFKMDNIVDLDERTLTEKHTLTIEYERLPEYTLSVYKMVEDEMLMPEKSFWKRLKKAIKYLFKGGKEQFKSDK